MFGLSKKKKEEDPLPPGAPISQVDSMVQQGYTNDQIIQMLQSQGYSSSQIFEALNQAGPSSGPQQMPSFGMDPSYMQQPPQMEQPYVEQPQQSSERIEEIAEAIIDEKWNEFTKEVTKIIEWKERTESRLTRIEQDIQHLKESFDLLHKSVLGKISEYDKNITEVSTGINAMERVFQKILPSLTENVNRLSRITDNIKKK